MFYKESIEQLYKKDGDLKSWLLENACKDYYLLNVLDNKENLNKDQIIAEFNNSIEACQKRIEQYKNDLNKYSQNSKEVQDEYNKYILSANKEYNKALTKKQVFTKQLELLKALFKIAKNDFLKTILKNTIEELPNFIHYCDIELVICSEKLKKTYDNFISENKRNIEDYIKIEENNIINFKNRLKLYSKYAEEVEKLFK